MADDHDRYDYSPIVERPDYDWPEGIARHEDTAKVWFTRPGEIARHVITLSDGTVPGG